MKEKSFYEFAGQLKEYLSKALDDNVKIDIHETVKNNGVTYDAVAILERDHNISPNIRLDGFYHSYLEGIDLAQIAEEIVEIYKGSRREKMDVSFFTDFEKAKSNILMKVIGYDKNKKRLKDIPHIKFMDLALTFYFYIEVEGCADRSASIQIDNGHLEMWKIDMGRLYDLAVENTRQKMPVSLRNMKEIIVELLKREGVHSSQDAVEDFQKASDELPMYVLSNRKNYFGATTIYYPGVLKEFAKKVHSDLIILPSSVHEVILLPADGSENIGELNEMIADINLNQVAEDEVLSDHLYYYDLTRDEIRIPAVGRGPQML